jgi:HD-like signal output (HDOD) protein/ActR/RegA family two-component response regulator
MVLCHNSGVSETIAVSLKRLGLEVFVAKTPTEAFDSMDRSPCDMVIAEENLGASSGLDFLAEARKRFPIAQRVLLASAPVTAPADTLVNQAGLCAIFQNSFHSQDICRLLALEGAVTHAGAAPSVDIALENTKLQTLCKRMDAENKGLLKEVERLREERDRRDERLSRRAVESAPAVEANPDAPSAIDPAELAEMTAQLTKAIDRMLLEDGFSLPVLPRIGLEVQRMAADENCSFDDLALKVGIEQGLSARILQVSNSAMYAGLKRVRNLRQAVTRLGLRETRNVLQAVIAENLFKTRNKVLMRLMGRLWMHSLCAGYCNENIARMLELPNSEDYFMMGLLHDIGKLLALHAAEKLAREGNWPREKIHEEALRGVMNAIHHEAGARLMEKWEYSAAFRRVVLLHNDDANIHKHDEAVIVTYYSNLLTRKLGYSLVPWRADLLDNRELSAALNMTPGARYALEENLTEMVEQIKESYFMKSGG